MKRENGFKKGYIRKYRHHIELVEDEGESYEDVLRREVENSPSHAENTECDLEDDILKDTDDFEYQQCLYDRW